MLDKAYIPLFVGGLIAWIGIMIAIGYFTSRGKTSGKDFLTGGGEIPFFLTFCTIGATMIGAGSSMGAVSNGFNYGWAGAIFGVANAVGLIVLSTFTPVRNKNFMTMSEEAQYYYGGKKAVRQVMGFMMYIAEVVWLGNSINGGAKYLEFITGMDAGICKLLTLIGFAVYVFLGGYFAVVTTDAVQFIVLILGFSVIVFRSVPLAGGYSQVVETFTNSGKGGALSFFGISAYGIMPAIALFCSSMFGVIGSPTCRTRIYTAKDEKTARKAIFGQTGFVFVWAFITATIGMCCYTIVSQRGVELASGDLAFAYMATHVFGPLLGLFFMIAGISATMSSGDSDAIAGITILLTDVYPSISGKAIKEENFKKYSRIALVVTLLLSFFSTMFASDIMSYLSTVMGALLPGLACAMLLGRFWKRVNWQGGLACIISGTVFGCAVLFVAPFKRIIMNSFGGPALPAFLISLIAAVLVSLITPVDQTSEQERMEVVFKDRRGMTEQL